MPSKLDPWKPYAWMVEPERTYDGRLEQVATIFLTNRTCPFDCVMCDLHRYTTAYTVPVGAIPAQIDYALARLPDCRRIKLYNAGNFFDRRAIPPEDYGAIASRLDPFTHVIVENHPSLTNETSVRFADMLKGKLEIALGLEIAHDPSLALLNKRMTTDSFARAAAFLRDNGIGVRVFVLLWAPFFKNEEGLDHAIESTRFAFKCDVDCVSLVPLRTTTSAVLNLVTAGVTSEPTIYQIESAFESCLAISGGTCLVDLWDIERFNVCPMCGPARKARLRRMNLTQTVPPPVMCRCRPNQPSELA